MHELNELIRQQSQNNLLSWSAQVDLAKKNGLTVREIEEYALTAGIMPARYIRNTQSINVEEQHILFSSKVAVIGCGGLGGNIIEQLARIGVGSLLCWDYDTFEEHNLNRQILSNINVLGQSKAKTAQKRINELNPAADVHVLTTQFDEPSGIDHLRDQHVVVDALDSIPARLILSKVCHKLNIPLVHGAIGGWYGQVCTQFPGEATLENLYYGINETGDLENNLGNLACTAAVIASFEAAEVIKILLNKGDLIRNKVMFINLLETTFDLIDIS